MNETPPQRRPAHPKTGRLFRIVNPARRFAPPPRAIRTAHLDNLALLPANLLPFKAEYQALANQQAPGTTLVVLPMGNSLPRRTLEQVALRMQARGQPVMVIQATEHRSSGHRRRDP